MSEWVYVIVITHVLISFLCAHIHTLTHSLPHSHIHTYTHTRIHTHSTGLRLHKITPLQETRDIKYIYNNIVYITEADKKTSVTCYSETQLPITAASIDTSIQNQIEEQKRRIQTKAAAVTSHTVLIVDQSTR